ncbi:MAG: DUF1800 family protein [Gaiellaceae bacterium]
MVKPPVVLVAGMLRGLGRGVDTDAWAWIGDMCGQHLFYPPNVSGWQDERWLDTATFRGRWHAVNRALAPYTKDPDDERGSEPLDAGSARRACGRVLGLSDHLGPHARGPGRVRPAGDRGRERRLEAGGLTGADPERAPPARARLPRLPDQLRGS